MESVWGDMLDTEDKRAWCREGQGYEFEFVRDLAPQFGLPLQINPQKEHNPYVPDLLYDGKRLADLKTQRTPFFTASSYGLRPQYTVTFNEKDYLRYKSLYPDLKLYFWVRWDRTEYERDPSMWVDAMEGVWEADFTQIAELIETRQVALHAYQRRVNDQAGNARASYLINLKRLKCVGMLRTPVEQTLLHGIEPWDDSL